MGGVGGGCFAVGGVQEKKLSGPALPSLSLRRERGGVEGGGVYKRKGVCNIYIIYWKLLSHFIYSPFPFLPLPLSLRERGEGRIGGVYKIKKGKEEEPYLLVFNIYINIYLNKYIIYILKTIANINYIDICNWCRGGGLPFLPPLTPFFLPPFTYHSLPSLSLLREREGKRREW